LSGKYLDEALGGKKNLSAEKNNIEFYSIAKSSNKEIVVSRIGWDVPIPEPLLYKKDLVSGMNNIGIDIIQFKDFKNYYNDELNGNKQFKLSPGEKKISFLHQMFVFGNLSKSTNKYEKTKKSTNKSYIGTRITRKKN
jgi:hypothetical protein